MNILKYSNVYFNINIHICMYVCICMRVYVCIGEYDYVFSIYRSSYALFVYVYTL